MSAANTSIVFILWIRLE